MIIWGTLVVMSNHQQVSIVREWAGWLLSLFGIALALYTFIADAIRVADQGVDGLRNLLPKQFNWYLFVLALMLMTAPVIQIWRHRWLRADLQVEPTGALD